MLIQYALGYWCKHWSWLANLDNKYDPFFSGCHSRSIYLIKKQEAAAVSIQKYARRWLFRHNYLQICSAVVLIQSGIRGSSTRLMALRRKQHRAAILIQVILFLGLISSFWHCALLQRLFFSFCSFLSSCLVVWF